MNEYTRKKPPASFWRHVCEDITPLIYIYIYILCIYIYITVMYIEEAPLIYIYIYTHNTVSYFFWCQENWLFVPASDLIFCLGFDIDEI